MFFSWIGVACMTVAFVKEMIYLFIFLKLSLSHIEFINILLIYIVLFGASYHLSYVRRYVCYYLPKKLLCLYTNYYFIPVHCLIFFCFIYICMIFLFYLRYRSWSLYCCLLRNNLFCLFVLENTKFIDLFFIKRELYGIKLLLNHMVLSTLHKVKWFSCLVVQ